MNEKKKEEDQQLKIKDIRQKIKGEMKNKLSEIGKKLGNYINSLFFDNKPEKCPRR
jgi:hypothetical protein